MIKFSGKGVDGPLYGLGLSYANLDKLREGKPIHINLADMGGNGRVLIFAGETEDKMVEQLAPELSMSPTGGIA